MIDHEHQVFSNFYELGSGQQVSVALTLLASALDAKHDGAPVKVGKDLHYEPRDGEWRLFRTYEL